MVRGVQPRVRIRPEMTLKQQKQMTIEVMKIRTGDNKKIIKDLEKVRKE